VFAAIGGSIIALFLLLLAIDGSIVLLLLLLGTACYCLVAA